MFTSSSSIVAMPCGHYLHKMCYTQYMEIAYKCPVCKKSAVNMDLQWRKLEHAIESQPMPDELRDTLAMVQCNDCNQKSSVRYHWLGNKCGACDSFNTNEIQLLGPSSEDTAQAQQRNIDNISQMREQTRPRFPWTRSRTFPAVLQSPAPGGGANAAHRSPGSYFLSVQDSTVDNDPERRGSAAGLEALAQNIPFSPLEMFQRVSRSLSPIRHYLNGSDSEGEDSDADVDFWGTDGRFLSGEEDDDDDDDDDYDDEDYDDDEEDSSDEDDEDEDDDDESEGEGRGGEHDARTRGELDDLDELIGHR